MNLLYGILVCLAYFLFLIVALHIGNNIEFMFTRLANLVGVPMVKAPYRDSLDRIEWVACIQSTLVLLVAILVFSVLALL